MRYLRGLVRRIAALLGASRDEELSAELESHVSLHVDDLMRQGLDRGEARRRALLRLGGLDATKEAYRDRRSLPIVEAFIHDVRYAFRLMRRNRGFTAVAAITLALGIGANTAIFSLVDAVLLKTLPVDDPSRLVVLDKITPRGTKQNISNPLFERLRDQTQIFSGVFAALDGTYNYEIVGPAPARVRVQAPLQLVSGEYFSVLGVSPLMGRMLTPDDNRVGDAASVAVMSHEFWQRRFDRDPNVIGQSLIVKGQTVTIVGVAPPGFFGESVGRAPSLWLPLAIQPRYDRSLLSDPNVGWLRVMARLRPEVDEQQASAALTTVVTQILREPGSDGKPVRWLGIDRIEVSAGGRGLADFRERFSRPLRILTGIVGLVLLIACANVSNLLLARAAGRQREIAVRLAIGAARRRLLTQLLTEGALLAALGGTLGILLAWWGSNGLLRLASSDTSPIPIDVTPNLRLLAFTVAVSLVTVVVFGLAPAVTASNVDVNGVLKRATSGPVRARLSRGLVVTQVAMSLVLLSGAGLFLRTLHNLRTRDVGYPREMLMQGRIPGGGRSPAQIAERSQEIVARLASIPGVQAATLSSSGIGTGTSTTCCIAVEGFTHVKGEDRDIGMIAIAPDYFRAIGLPIVRGRALLPSDRVAPGMPLKTAVVNEAFVRRYLGPGDPIGRRFGWGDPPKVTYSIEIIGVVKDALYGDLRQASRPLLYTPFGSMPVSPNVLVRTSGAPQTLIETIRREVATIDPTLDFRMRPLSVEVDRMLVREMLLSRLSGFFAVLAVVLAGIGVYGVMAYTIGRRTREIAICVALGAARRSILGGELRSALALVAIGIAAGVPAAIVGGRLVASQLFGVSTADPTTLTAVAALLALVAAVAAYLPARRAARVDPTLALRWE